MADEFQHSIRDRSGMMLGLVELDYVFSEFCASVASSRRLAM